MMRHSEIKTAEDALAYLADCTLATVCSMKLRKSSPRGELDRQIAIAQTAVDVIRTFKVNCDGTRTRDVIDGYKGQVKAWADTYSPC